MLNYEQEKDSLSKKFVKLFVTTKISSTEDPVPLTQRNTKIKMGTKWDTRDL